MSIITTCFRSFYHFTNAYEYAWMHVVTTGNVYLFAAPLEPTTKMTTTRDKLKTATTTGATTTTTAPSVTTMMTTSQSLEQTASKALPAPNSNAKSYDPTAMSGIILTFVM